MYDRYQVQNYLQIKHADGSEKYIAMTCSAEYMRDQSVATNVEIKNFYGTESFKISDRGAYGRKDDFGTPAPADMQFFEKALNTNYAYRSATQRKASWQSCGARHKLWETMNGEAVDPELNMSYWSSKDAGSVTFETGYRVWENASTSSLAWYGDAPATQYSLHDFEISRPLEPEKREEKILALSDIQDQYGVPVLSGSVTLLASASITLIWTFIF